MRVSRQKLRQLSCSLPIAGDGVEIALCVHVDLRALLAGNIGCVLFGGLGLNYRLGIHTYITGEITASKSMLWNTTEVEKGL